MIFYGNIFYDKNEWYYVGYNHQYDFKKKLMEDNLKILIILYFEKNGENVEDTQKCNFLLLK